MTQWVSGGLSGWYTPETQDLREYVVPATVQQYGGGTTTIRFWRYYSSNGNYWSSVITCNYDVSGAFSSCSGPGVVPGAGVLATSVESTSPGAAWIEVFWTANDGNPCTTDTCAGGAPSHTNVQNGTACGSDACTTAALCQAGTCVPGTPLDFDDGNACTDDACDSTSGISHTFRSADPQCAPPPALAPEGNLTVPTSFSSSVNGLASNQQAAGLDPSRVAVLRGRVFDTAVAPTGTPLSGVTVRALGQPALGSTTTSSVGNYAGWYDFVANGGGDVVLVFEKSGYLPVQRHADARWNDTTVLDDVVMVPENTAGVTIHQNVQTWQRAEGLVSPAEGSTPARKSVVLFPPGWAVTTQSWPGNTGADVTIRSTEYTTGASGPLRMPGDLPPATGYTYASEFVVKEARDANVTTVAFPATAPAIGYVQALTPTSPTSGSMPGDPIPVGTYDPASGFWKGENAGTILQYLGQTNGKADLDCGGAGCGAAVDGGAGLGITDGEREQVAQLGYSAGQLLWRFVQPHFSAWDTNWGFGPPPGAVYPPDAEPTADVAVDDPTCRAGSIIECENRVLRESIPIAGSPYALHYSSERQDGYRQQITIPIAGPTPPTHPQFKRVEYDVQIAGQRYFGIRPAGTIAPNDRVVVSWDRRDGWGRRVQGSVRANIRVAYVYTGQTYSGGDWATPIPAGGSVSGDRAYREVKLYRYISTKVVLPLFDAKPLGFGGWTFGPDHVLDPVTRTAYFGDGSRRDTAGDAGVAYNVAGFGTGSVTAGASARGAAVQPTAIALGADGAVYMGGGNSAGKPYAIRRVDPGTGLLSYVLGTDGSTAMNCSQIQACAPGESPCTAPASAAQPSVTSIAVGPDGTVYFASEASIYKVSTDSPRKLYRLAGACAGSTIGSVGGISVTRDGSVVFHSQSNGASCIRKLTREGTVRTIAGDCSVAGTNTNSLVDGSAFVPFYTGGAAYPVAAGLDGSVYAGIYDRVVRVLPSGSMQIVTAASGAPNTDGRLAGATHAGGSLTGLALATDGALFLSVNGAGGYRVRRIAAGGIVTTVLGASSSPIAEGIQVSSAAPSANPILGIAAGPDGAIYWAEFGNVGPTTSYAGVRKTRILTPDAVSLVPGPEGTLEFCPDGRLLRTRSPVHGDPLFTFLRGGATTSTCSQAPDLLTRITDLVGNTDITRQTASVTIQPPNGAPATTITLDSNGYAQQVSNGTQTWLLTHGSAGLLTALRDPNGRDHVFTYDGAGRLLADKNPMPATAGTRLDATIEDRKRTVRVTSPEGRLTTHVIDTRGVADTNVFERRTTTTEGIAAYAVEDKARGGVSASRVVDVAQVDGGVAETVEVETTTTRASDTGRWFMQAPWVKRAQEKRGSYTRTVDTVEHTVVAADPGVVTSQTDKWHVTGAATGKDAVASYSASTSSWSLKSPERNASSTAGTETQVLTDSYDRPLTIQRVGAAPTLSPVQIGYTNGRVTSVTQGSRSVSFGYSGPWLQSVTTTGLGTVSYANFDGVGRPGLVVLPSPPNQPRSIGLSYDPVGNVTSLEPPNGPFYTHNFTPNAVDLLATYSPPPIVSPSQTSYAYDRDSLLTAFTAPAQSPVSYTRDTAGRVTIRASAQANVYFAYDQASGKLASANVQGVQNAFTYCNGTTVPGPTGLLCRETVSGLLPAAKTIDYGYDTRLRLATRTLEGRVVGFQYDDDDRLVAVTLASSEILRLTYSSSGFLSKLTAKVGATARDENYTYADGTGDLTRIASTSPQYWLDTQREATTGRVTRWEEQLGGANTVRLFTYDGANRLASETYNGSTSYIPYDAHGNYDALSSVRLVGSASQTWTGGTQYDTQDRIVTGGGWPTWTWNQNGDLAGLSNGSATYNFAYDVFGNLRTATGPGRNLAYVIDAFDRRVQKTGGSGKESYLYDATGRMVAWYDASNNLKGQFVYASRGHVPDLMIDASGTVFRIVTDHLGSVRLVYNVSTGVATQQTSYGAFGLPVGATARAVPFAFAGGLWDQDLGMVRFGARDFDPYKGRWVTKDRARFAGGDNFYQYADGDPVNYVDPTGFKVGVPYDNWQQAAFAAGEEYNRYSMDTDRELAGLVFESNGKFYHTRAVDSFMNDDHTSQPNLARLATLPKGVRVVAGWHTHADFRVGRNECSGGVVSPLSLADRMWVAQNGMPLSVTTAGGNFGYLLPNGQSQYWRSANLFMANYKIWSDWHKPVYIDHDLTVHR